MCCVPSEGGVVWDVEMAAGCRSIVNDVEELGCRFVVVMVMRL